MTPLPTSSCVVPIDGPYDFTRTIGALICGPDPTSRRVDTDVWSACRTPQGGALVRYRRIAEGVDVRAWGPGHEWMVLTAPDTVGANDVVHELPGDAQPAVTDAMKSARGWRLCATRRPFDALVQAVLGQRVTGGEALRSWAGLVRMVSPQLAPCPTGAPELLLPPDPARVAIAPSWSFHRLGVERKRAETIVRLARHATHLEPTAFASPEAARRAWQQVPGIGEWTSAEAARLVLGDPDAVSVGDYHWCHTVGFALAGEVRSTDERMLELLEPYRPQRGRIAQALARAGHHAPRFGPRYRPLPIASW